MRDRKELEFSKEKQCSVGFSAHRDLVWQKYGDSIFLYMVFELCSICCCGRIRVKAFSSGDRNEDTLRMRVAWQCSQNIQVPVNL